MDTLYNIVWYLVILFLVVLFGGLYWAVRNPKRKQG